MSVRQIGWMGMLLAVLASGGCCWFCERHCPQCAKAPVYAAPAAAPAGGCCCVPCSPAGYTPATTATTTTPAWSPPAAPAAQCTCPATR